MSTICIYHGHCPDGFASALAVHLAFPNELIELHSGVYQRPPPDVTDKKVIMVDFSYDTPSMEKMLETSKEMIWIDHHISALERLKHLSISGLQDVNHSGAVLTWKYFHGDTPCPLLFQYVEDRDLWKFSLPNSKEVSQYILSTAYNFVDWLALMDELEEHFNLVVSKGEAILNKFEKDIKELMLKTLDQMNIGGYLVPVCNLPYTMASEVAGRLAVNQPFAACYYLTKEGVQFSLRSTEDGFDVSKIAMLYGGGGHTHAAGFEVNKNLFFKMMLRSEGLALDMVNSQKKLQRT